MEIETNRMVRLAAFTLIALAVLATEISTGDPHAVMKSLAWGSLWIGLVALAGWLSPRPKDYGKTLPTWMFAVLITLGVVPFLAEPARRYWFDIGYPLEIQMVFGLRNVGLGLAAFAGQRLCLRLTCVVSLFLMLFAITVTDRLALLAILGVYGTVGSVWLMVAYWTGLRGTFVTADTAVVTEIQVEKERFPWFAASLTIMLVTSVIGLAAAGPQRTAGILFELLPTSGGTGAYDQFARGGVNDGDDETRGANPNSTGMIQTDTFLDSPLPSLYDLFNDMYGEPYKPRLHERAIALDSQTKINENNKKPSDNLRPNREFPTARKSPQQARDSSNRSARAIFEVQGRTPLHLRVTAFDVFDGLAWKEASVGGGRRLLKDPNSCWMEVQNPNPIAIFADTETHQIKVAKSPGSLVPAPPHLARFRIGRVNQADFFNWSQPGILRMAHRKTPTGIIVETVCRTVDTRCIKDLPFVNTGCCEDPAHLQLPTTLDPEVSRLARSWVNGAPSGWPQVMAVVKRLREDYVLDSMVSVPEDCRDPVAHFLFSSRRGPDYQFASAASILLGSLGHRTRLVSGFYVAPAHYDPETHHTPVVKEDLHFWTEVMLPNGDWLVVEPSPGYEVMGPALSLPERIWNGLASLADWTRQHFVELALGIVFLLAVGRWRFDLMDVAVSAGFTLFPGRTWQQCARRALWLLEWRARLAGLSRPHSQTVPTWLHTILSRPTSDDADLHRLTAVATWAAYAPYLDAPWSHDDVQAVCGRMLNQLTLRRWRHILAERARKGESA